MQIQHKIILIWSFLQVLVAVTTYTVNSNGYFQDQKRHDASDSQGPVLKGIGPRIPPGQSWPASPSQWQIRKISGDKESAGDTNANELPTYSRGPFTYSNDHVTESISTKPIDTSTSEISDKIDVPTLTIAVLGRSGAGVTSTILELIGPETKCVKPDETASFKDIMVYEMEIPTSTSNESIWKLKLLDIPGFVDGRNMDEESQILSSLKSFVQSTGPPDFYLAISRFDDNRIGGIHSLFVQFLKRVELFHEVFINNTVTNHSANTKSNILFLLTRLMSETKMNQRKPQEKINEFVRVIQEFTSFPSPISVVIGENKAGTEYGAKVENGYYKLPNKQFYPKNIWEALIELSTEDNTKDVLTAVMNKREETLKCEVKLISTDHENFDNDADAFSYLLTLENKTVENTEINQKLQEIFLQNNNAREQMEGVVQKLALQLRLQQENITNKANLPTSLVEKAAFFRSNNQVSGKISARLLDQAFGLKMPEYVSALTVGYGFVLLEDEMSLETPFKNDVTVPSQVGYQLPDFMTCRKLVTPEIQYFKSYSVNMSDYIRERLKYLDFPGKENVSESRFHVKVKEGFNLQPEGGDNLVTLTAVEERRMLTCMLVSNSRQSDLDLDPRFIEEVNALTEFDKHDRDSVTEWKNWFSKWGSHIVVQSYGGGRVHGSIVGSNVRNVLESQSTTDETLNSIINFSRFPIENLTVPSYRFYGGESDAESANLYSLEENDRKTLMKRWEESLNSDFIMLTNELRLEPISNVIKTKIGLDKGEIVEQAINLLLAGELKYKRKKGNSKGGGRNKEGNNHNQEGVREAINQIGDTDLLSANTHLQRLPTRTQNPSMNAGTGALPIPNTEGVNLDGTQQYLESQIRDINEMIANAEQMMAAAKARGEAQNQKSLEELKRLKIQQSRLQQQRQDELDRQHRLAMERNKWQEEKLLNEKRKHEEYIRNLREETEQIKKHTEEENRRHQMLLEQLKKEQEEAEKREKERCSGWWKKIQCGIGL